MSSDPDIGNVASNVTSSFDSLTQLITAGSYAAGTAFGIAQVAKFKAHSDNPTQVPMSTPIALLAVSVAVSFLTSE